MGFNPHPNVKNSTLSGVFYRPNGDVGCIVHPDNDDFSKHIYPIFTRVIVPYDVYASADPPINYKGFDKHHGLNKVILPHIQAQHPVFAPVVQARTNAFDKWFADVGVASANANAASVAFLNVLSASRRAAWDNISTPAALTAFKNAMNAVEQARFDALTVADKAYADVYAGGPNP